MPKTDNSKMPLLPTFASNSVPNRNQILSYLVAAGKQAPSWYNCQPWKFLVIENHIDILMDNDRDQSFYNWGNFNTLLSSGAVIKNILIAAQALGVGADVTLLPDNANTMLVARILIDFEKRSQPSKKDLALERAIWLRHTNTLLFEKQPISESEIQTLQKAIEKDKSLELYWLTDDKNKENIYDAVSCAEQIRFSRRDLHEQLHRMIRWNQKEAFANRTGYTLASMGACIFGKSFFWLTKSWRVMCLMNKLGAYKSQAQRACVGLKHCGAVGALTVEESSPKGLLSAGIGMQSVWLQATLAGFQVQPHNSMLHFFWSWQKNRLELFDDQEKQILETAWEKFCNIFPSLKNFKNQQPVFLFRIGKGSPMVGHTLRETAMG